MSSAQIGKALCVKTPIVTPNGWKLMGDIVEGDIVFDENGNQCNVVGATEFQYNRECYSVKFSDGSEIIADADHRWYVEPDCRKPTVLTTKDMLHDYKYGSRNHRNRYAIPVAKAIKTDHVELPIDPWLLGAWLGDGHSYSARIYCHIDDALFIENKVSTAGHKTQIDVDGCHIVRIDPQRPNICVRGHDKEITGYNGKHGCAECGRIYSKNFGRVKRGCEPEKLDETTDTFIKSLHKLNLVGDKYIPTIYLRASINQRMELLRGLMDTDGYVSKNSGRSEYITTSPKIAEGMGELLHSLGIKHTCVMKKPTTTYNGRKVYGAEAFRFSFLVYDDKPVFAMPRKLNNMVSREGRRTTETERRRIIDISPVESRPVKCISVDSPNHLYLAGESMIPTHNTEWLLNVIGYYIDYDPSPMLLLQPTLSMAEAFSKDRLAPMLRDTPALKNSVKDPRARDSGNTQLHKQFPGGHITMAGANSPASLASRPIRIFLADEVDRYPISAGTEGDPLSLGGKRTTTFYNKKKIYTSTPTVKGASRIEDAFEKSDMRRYHVPCPHCEEKAPLKWSQIHWDRDENNDHLPETAHYVCESCGGVWHDHQKIKQMRAGGEWIAEKPFIKTAGFHLNELYSPWVKWSSVVSDFLEAKNDTELIKTWTNTSLGETYEEAGDQIDNTFLYARREDYAAQVPQHAVVLTAGVDVQEDRLEVEIVGWGLGEESWNIDYRVIQGDTSKPEVWKDLEDVIFNMEFDHESGNTLKVAGTMIDTGYRTQIAYDFIKKHKGRRVYAGKGVAGPGRPIISQSRGRSGGNKQRKVDLYTIGVDDAKILLSSRLKVLEHGAGYCHFPMERDEEYFLQLTAEKMVTKFRRGFPYREWVQTRARNEATDCRVYSHAVLKLLNVNWESLVERVKPLYDEPKDEKPVEEIKETTTQAHIRKVTRPKPKSNFVNRW